MLIQFHSIIIIFIKDLWVSLLEINTNIWVLWYKFSRLTINLFYIAVGRGFFVLGTGFIICVFKAGNVFLRTAAKFIPSELIIANHHAFVWSRHFQSSRSVLSHTGQRRFEHTRRIEEKLLGFCAIKCAYCAISLWRLRFWCLSLLLRSDFDDIHYRICRRLSYTPYAELQEPFFTKSK